MKTFAASVIAMKYENCEILIVGRPVILQAENNPEAVGICILASKIDWYPESDGWVNHQASVLEFDDALTRLAPDH